MVGRRSIKHYLQQHEHLDQVIGVDRRNFPSDWDGTHPFVDAFLGPDALSNNRLIQSPSRYLYFDEQNDIIASICKFHQTLENLHLSQSNVLAGPGSSSLIAAICTWLTKHKHRTIHYLAPLYHTFHYFFHIFGITAERIDCYDPFNEHLDGLLPELRTVLLLTDPIWFAGRHRSTQTISYIADWQHRTQSLVIVDGSFQYMQWDHTRRENTSLLDKELTMRIICPAKALAVPAFRFSYLLHPSECHAELLFLYESMVGSSSIGDLQFARRALSILAHDESTFVLTNFLRERFHALQSNDTFRTVIEPTCGYFVFGKPKQQLPSKLFMGQEYFDLTGYDNYVRINLMSSERLGANKPEVGAE